MLRLERHDDVTRLFFETWRSRSMGFAVSCYAVRGVLVDTAFHGVRAELGGWLDANRPDGVILTHYHEDHAGNVELLARRGLPLWIAPQTAERVSQPKALPWYRTYCWGSPPALVSQTPSFAHPALQIIHTPGHSSEHHIVWDAERETIFGADLFLGVKVRDTHPWPFEDVRAQVPSLRKIVALKPKRFFDAHRGLVPDPVAQLTAKADWIEQTVGEIDVLIARGLTDDAIVKLLLGGETRMAYYTAYGFSRRNFVHSVRESAPARV